MVIGNVIIFLRYFSIVIYSLRSLDQGDECEEKE
jgi:hypothetical protein